MRAFSVLSACGLFIAVAGAAHAQGVPLPWGQPSDMAAWEAFVQVTAPSGNPKTTNVEFETWASDQDVYVKLPPQWPTIGAPKQLQRSVLGNSHQNFKPFVIVPGQCLQNFDQNAAKAAGFPLTGCIGEEVRRNWASFQYIVANQLYSQTGLAQAFQKGFKVDFPADAIEVKADWIKTSDLANWLHISEQQVRQVYYTNQATAGGLTTEFALASFHISTKQIKDWVWSDFENQMNPGRCDVIGCRDSFGAAISNVPANTTLNQQYGQCDKSPALQAMFTSAGLNPIWGNYCLKGSQVTFIDENGQPTLLGNSVIERINAGVPIAQSSCITCHAYASFDATGSPSAAFTLNPIGNVDQAKLQNYLTNDFLWGNNCVMPGRCP
jgi:hypothetical protein